MLDAFWAVVGAALGRLVVGVIALAVGIVAFVIIWIVLT